MGKMDLSNTVSGKRDTPKRLVLVGPEGIGKSTWGAGSEAPIFLAPDDGTDNLDIVRFPKPEVWEDVLEAVRVLGEGNHKYKTLVVDTLDACEPLLWEYICKRDKKKSIEDYGYGKGYVAALEEWRSFASQLDALRMKVGMEVILLAHAQIRTFKNPTGEDFDRYEMKLHTKAGGFIKEWADAVLFANYETHTRKDGLRVKGVGGGSRVVHTERRAAWDAKNRFNLPEKMPLSYDDFVEAIKYGAPADPAELKASITKKLELLKDEKVTAYVNDRVETATAADLAKINDRLNAKIAEQEDSNAEA